DRPLPLHGAELLHGALGPDQLGRSVGRHRLRGSGEDRGHQQAGGRDGAHLRPQGLPAPDGRGREAPEPHPGRVSREGDHDRLGPGSAASSFNAEGEEVAEVAEEMNDLPMRLVRTLASTKALSIRFLDFLCALCAPLCALCGESVRVSPYWLTKLTRPSLPTVTSAATQSALRATFEIRTSSIVPAKNSVTPSAAPIHSCPAPVAACAA